MEKNQKVLIIIIGLVLIISGIIGFLAFKDQKENKKTEINKFKEEYESLNGVVNDNGYTYPTVDIDVNNPIIYSNEDEVLNILKDGTGIIYFGFPTCPWCRNMVSTLVSAAESTNFSKIYYLNVLDLRDSLSVNDNGEISIDKKGSKNYKKILKKLDDILDEYYIKDAAGNKVDTNEKRLYVPLVIAVSNGKVVSYHANTVDSHVAGKNGYAEMTKEQKEELFDIYINMISKLSNSSCNDENC